MRSVRRVRPRTGVLVVAAGLAVGMTGCVGLAVFKDVPPTFAKLAAPPTEILPDPEKATILVASPAGAYDGGSQAITVLADDGTPIAQVPPRSYAVVRVEPGEHWFTALVPETPTPWCLKYMSGSFEKGKIYTFNLSDMDASKELSLFGGVSTAIESEARREAGEGDRTGKVLSKLSYFEVDLALAREYGEKHRAALDGCVESVMNPADEFAAKFAQAPGDGRDRIDIPPPP
jgi:hypothetical protein